MIGGQDMKHPDVGRILHCTDPVIWIRCFFLFSCIFLTTSLSGQEKGRDGLVPVAPGSGGGVTRAVVVGISDYQHPDIPDLRFAHRDAEAFVEWLRSPSGGSVPERNIQLLTNQTATSARFDSELSWIYEESQPGDRAFIYFSGHGDVEQRYNNDGFLLCSDAAPKLYGSNGALGVYLLKGLVRGLSDKRVRVILISDACHAGKLSGSPIGGKYLTSKSMAEQFTNEIKLLACQPDELSRELPNLDDGRGVFSYYLVQGLLGFADEDGDNVVKLRELMRFLTHKVPTEIAPVIQNPLCIGNPEVTLSQVDTFAINRINEGNKYIYTSVTQFDQRAYENHLLELNNDSIIHFNSKLQHAINRKAFFEPYEDCAETWFKKLTEHPEINDELVRFVKRYYSVALQDDVQQAINSILDSELRSGPETRIMIHDYKNYPRQLSRSAEILTPHHFMYLRLKAREKWLKGFLLYGNNSNSTDPEIGHKIISLLDSSLALEHNSPIVHYYLALTYINIMQMPDSALAHVRLANSKAMNWTLPNTHIATLLSKKPYYYFTPAKQLLIEAQSMDSTSVLVWRGLGALHYYQKEYQEAEYYFRRALKQDSTNGISWSNLAAVISSPTRYSEAEQILTEGIKKCPETGNLRYVYGCILANTQRTARAIQLFNEAKQINPHYKPSRDSLVEMYLRIGQQDQAVEELNELLQMNVNDFTAYFRLALIFLEKNDLNQVRSNLDSYFATLESNQQKPRIDPRIDWFVQNEELRTFIEPYIQNKQHNE